VAKARLLESASIVALTGSSSGPILNSEPMPAFQVAQQGSPDDDDGDDDDDDDDFD